MIRVDRNAVPPPALLTDADGAGLTETKEAIAFYAKKANLAKAFPFEIYSHDEVKHALEQLFHKKCAYCESPYVVTQPMDVEHWRPKGAVEIGKGKKKKPAYYWLAARWENLLPSCTDCNRRRYQIVPGSEEEILLGKQNQFPIADEQNRAKEPGDEQNEEPLLLNPCNDTDEPALHLEFIEDPPGDKAVMRPRTLASGQDSPRGLASIRVYALNRTELVQARRKLFLDIEGKIATIRALMLAVNKAATEADRQIFDASLKREMEALRSMKDPGSPYSALARQIIGKYMESLTQ